MTGTEECLHRRVGLLVCLAALLIAGESRDSAALSQGRPGVSTRTCELPSDWTTQGGDWRLDREIVPFIHQRSSAAVSAASRAGLDGQKGAWRATVKLSQGADEAGLWVGKDLANGLFVLLGRLSDVGGFLLRSADGTALWQDRYAPWQPYQFYVVEAVVENGRMRVQMFEGDAKTLVSQSPWIPTEQPTKGARRLGLFTGNGAARFYASQYADEPLSPIVADPPNKRRLAQDDDSPWLVTGPGNWMWTTSRKERLRQYADCERTWAMHRGAPGALRQWQCRLKVDPGTKGAGLLFQTNEERDQGFIAWLGGKYGAGSLMLYQYKPEAHARWSGKSDSWHYDTEYLLRAETRAGQARVQLLEADGETVIADSSWVDVGNTYAAKEGCLAFHIWSGQVEFWGFSETTQAKSLPPRQTGQTDQAAKQLGGGWQAHGDGDWQWADASRLRLRQQGRPKAAMALDTQTTGSSGIWRCRVRAVDGASAVGLVFQSNVDRTLGYVCLLTTKGARLETAGGKTLWEEPKWTWQPATAYLLEGTVSTDRVAVRVLAADGRTVLTASPDIYVPESNNARRGHLGLTVRGGQAEFWEWRNPSGTL